MAGHRTHGLVTMGLNSRIWYILITPRETSFAGTRWSLDWGQWKVRVRSSCSSAMLNPLISILKRSTCYAERGWWRWDWTAEIQCSYSLAWNSLCRDKAQRDRDATHSVELCEVTYSHSWKWINTTNTAREWRLRYYVGWWGRDWIRNTAHSCSLVWLLM